MINNANVASRDMSQRICSRKNANSRAQEKIEPNMNTRAHMLNYRCQPLHITCNIKHTHTRRADNVNERVLHKTTPGAPFARTDPLNSMSVLHVVRAARVDFMQFRLHALVCMCLVHVPHESQHGMLGDEQIKLAARKSRSDVGWNK